MERRRGRKEEEISPRRRDASRRTRGRWENEPATSSLRSSNFAPPGLRSKATTDDDERENENENENESESARVS